MTDSILRTEYENTKRLCGADCKSAQAGEAILGISRNEASPHGFGVPNMASNIAFIDSQNVNLGVLGDEWKFNWRRFRIYLKKQSCACF